MYFNVVSAGVSYWFRDHDDDLTDKSLRSLENVEFELEPDGYGSIMFNDESRQVAVLCNQDNRSKFHQNTKFVKCLLYIYPKKLMSNDGYDNVFTYQGRDICEFSLNEYLDIHYHVDDEVFKNIVNSINFGHDIIIANIFFKIGSNESKLRHGSGTDTILWDISMNENVVPTGVNLTFSRKHTLKTLEK
jgi:hypothetical protein